ncbi:1,4-dihydroxy-2-naphthoate octaprenyltransferase [Bacterioplanoides sp.]|uniref:1,4-dihydroxy-2-naphthoate octaprenyltransferase n=1 Tax=Bacterioplanoides sp. TaxID=2066072 RepID=UPI003B5AC1EE
MHNNQPLNDQMPAWRGWIAAIRLKTLPAVLAPVILGQFLAWQAASQFSWFLAAVISGCALLLQIGVNLANDVFDFEAGVDGLDRLGPARAAQSGWLTVQQLRRGLILVLSLASLLGLVLVAYGGWLFLLLGSLSILAALAYSAGPFPLASHALGEVTVFLFFGLLAVVGGFYLQHPEISDSVWGYGAAMGALTAAIMLVNNIRDVSSDRAAGKHTLIVIIGTDWGRVFYGLLLFSASLWHLQFSLSAIFLCLISAALWRKLYRREGVALNQQLAQTAVFCLIYSLVVVADHWI